MRVSWLVSVYTMELRRLFSYRMDFWTQFLGALVAQFGVAWFLWKAIYAESGATEIGRFSFTGMMIYYLAAPLAAKTIQSAEIGDISQEIYDGSLTRYLVYPVSFFRYKLAAGLAPASVFAAQGALVLVIAAFTVGLPPEFHVSPFSVAAGGVSILLALYLHFVIVATVELVAFWADNVWSLVVILRFLTGLLGGAMLPLSLFPGWAHDLLYALPFAYFAAFPAETLLGLTTPGAWLRGMVLMALWSVAATLLYRAVWRRGMHQYSGVGI